MSGKSTIALFFLLSATASALETEQSLDVSLTLTPNWQPEINDQQFSTQDHHYTLNGQTSAFWNMAAYITNALSFNVRYGLSATAELDQSGNTTTANTESTYRVDDLPAEIHPTYYQNLDRLNVNAYSRFGDYTIGRQAISFGQAKFFSPVDVIYPHALYAIETDYRPGVDAIRATWPLGATSELEYGLLLNNEIGHFIRFKTYAFSADWEFVGLQLTDDATLLSAGTNGGINAVGLWQETALLIDQSSDKNRIRSTLGADYSFIDDLYIAAEVHYNGMGEAENYSDNSNKLFYQLGAVAPQAKWYASLQGTYPFNILIQASFGATANLNDGSTLLNTLLTYNATDTLTIHGSLLLPVAKKHSTAYEYGTYPMMGILQLDWVF